MTRAVGGGLDVTLAQLGPLLAPADTSLPSTEAAPPPRTREALLAALNGVLGDYLADTANPLEIRMAFRRRGVPLVHSREELAKALGSPRPRLVVLLHGLCMCDLQWERAALIDGVTGVPHDHGAELERDLGCSFGLPELQLGPAHLDQWPPAGRATRVAAGRLAGRDRVIGHRRPQHGRSRGPQRTALRNAGRSCLDPPRARDGVSWLTSPWITAGTRRPLDRRVAEEHALHRSVRSPGPSAKRRHHRPSSRQHARRGLARPRSIRAWA